MRRPLCRLSVRAVLALGLLLGASTVPPPPAWAQAEEIPFPLGTHAFRRILHETVGEKLTAIVLNSSARHSY